MNDNSRIFIAAVQIQTAKLEVIYVSENYTIRRPEYTAYC